MKTTPPRIASVAQRFALSFLFGCLVIIGCNSGSTSSIPSLAFVTNGDASFWVIAEKGVNAAGKEYNVQTQVIKPADGADQKQKVEDLLARGVDGIAISCIDPDNQTSLLNEAAATTNLITQDSDAPQSDRICYVGMDNYEAGRMCGELVKEAMPDGGTVMIFVGRIEQLNAKLRRQGVIDELLDRSMDRERYDPPGEPLKGEKYTILDTRTDQFDFGRAKSLAEEALSLYPDLGCMVGLFAYNPPKILEAVKEAKRLNKVKIVAFDEEDGTLQGIQDGHIHGTVVQNPYRYGVESIRILTGLARGDRSVLPEDDFLNIPARKITQENVESFWEELKKLTSDSPAT
ncbi:Monosaccharide ABC transporter substrate-binding protein, CUT2 family [Planctomycetales bacterium 10988]|nr:Monosaccharide ABC transporter substrate-binding protein, CUT2 family [Planctomycetales bacterium 10988]